jgi:hypothetical protein
LVGGLALALFAVTLAWVYSLSGNLTRESNRASSARNLVQAVVPTSPTSIPSVAPIAATTVAEAPPLAPTRGEPEAALRLPRSPAAAKVAKGSKAAPAAKRAPAGNVPVRDPGF